MNAFLGITRRVGGGWVGGREGGKEGVREGGGEGGREGGERREGMRGVMDEGGREGSHFQAVQFEAYYFKYRLVMKLDCVY